MEPKLPVPHSSPEMGAYNPQVLPPSPEAVPRPQVEAAPERTAAQEQQPAGPVHDSPTLPAPKPQPTATIAPSQAPPLVPLVTPDPNPTVAADDEVIEKEWVDKAKKIVTETKDDPYRQEKEVSKLQADYLKKRYGKEVKVASD